MRHFLSVGEKTSLKALLTAPSWPTTAACESSRLSFTHAATV